MAKDPRKDPVLLTARTLAASLRTGPQAAHTPAASLRTGPTQPSMWDLGDIGWREDRRQMYEREVAVPRLLRWYGGHETLPHPLLTDAREALNRYYAPELGERFVSAGMCLYRDGRDSVAWHGDRIGRGRSADTMVAIVSFGSPRPLMLRPAGGGGESLRFPLGHGDLVVMGGSCQRTWEHCIPKTAKAVGPRVSVQFRPRGVL
jgi:alkylated DNA repair dioxygenase AlkB